MLKEKERRPQSKSYVWLFRSGDDGEHPIIIYQYHPTRNGDAAAEFFQNSTLGIYTIETFTRRIYLNIYFNLSRQSADKAAFEADLFELKTLIEAGTPVEELSDAAQEK